MSNCINYNCSALEEHEKNECGYERLGGMSQMLVLDCDHTITDPSDSTQVQNNINSGKAILIQNIKAGIDAPSPIEVDKMVSNSSSYAVNYDRSVSVLDANINDQTIAFYNSILGGRSLGGLILYENADPDNDQVTWVDSSVLAVGGRIVPNDGTEQQRFEVTYKWKSKTEPLTYATPANIFN